MKPNLRMVDERVRFWAKVNIASGCWLWAGQIGNKGYGRFRLSKSRKMVAAHRYAYVDAIGPIPPGLNVLHHCDTPACVNPSHLFLGTIADNVADMFAKGRQPNLRGENNGQAKLTERDVIAIRNDADSTHKALGLKYGIAPSMVSMIKSGRYWKEVGNG